VLDAVDELVEAGRQKRRGERRAAGAEGSFSAPGQADRIAQRERDDGDGRKRRVERPEQHLEMVRILVMVVMDPLPGRGEQRHLEHPAAVQNPAVEHVPD